MQKKKRWMVEYLESVMWVIIAFLAMCFISLALVAVFNHLFPAPSCSICDELRGVITNV